MQKAWLCTAKTQFGLEHRTVRWCTGQCPVRQADSARTGCSREFADGVRLKFTGLSGVHRTVRCAPDCPVSQRSAEPTVGSGICARHVADPTVGRGTGLSGVHRTCPVRQRLPDLQQSATVGCAVYGNKSGTGQCPVCTGLSGAPDDRRQG
jgi:hypothetical protein